MKMSQVIFDLLVGRKTRLANSSSILLFLTFYFFTSSVWDRLISSFWLPHNFRIAKRTLSRLQLPKALYLNSSFLWRLSLRISSLRMKSPSLSYLWCKVYSSSQQLSLGFLSGFSCNLTHLMRRLWLSNYLAGSCIYTLLLSGNSPYLRSLTKVKALSRLTS